MEEQNVFPYYTELDNALSSWVMFCSEILPALPHLNEERGILNFLNRKEVVWNLPSQVPGICCIWSRVKENTGNMEKPPAPSLEGGAPDRPRRLQERIQVNSFWLRRNEVGRHSISFYNWNKSARDTLTNHNPESHLALPVNQEKSSSIAFKFCRNDCFKTTSDAFREQKVRDVGMCEKV